MAASFEICCCDCSIASVAFVYLAAIDVVAVSVAVAVALSVAGIDHKIGSEIGGSSWNCLWCRHSNHLLLPLLLQNHHGWDVFRLGIPPVTLPPFLVWQPFLYQILLLFGCCYCGDRFSCGGACPCCHPPMTDPQDVEVLQELLRRETPKRAADAAKVFLIVHNVSCSRIVLGIQIVFCICEVVQQ